MPVLSRRRPPTAARETSPPLRSPSPTLGTLRTAHRRISLARIAAYAATAAGPLALAASCLTPRTVVVDAHSASPAPAIAHAADPSGVAALFVDLWLRSDASAPQSADAQAAQQLAPNVSLPSAAGDTSTGALQRTVAVRSAQLSYDSWSVVVAAQFTLSNSNPGSGSTGSGAQAAVRYFAVPVVEHNGGGAGSFVVTSAPAQVAGPSTASAPASPYQNPVPSTGPLASSVSAFFSAYLAGNGDVAPYLSPGTSLAPVSGSGYQSVSVDQAATDAGTPPASVPADGARVHVQAQVTAKDAAGGQWPLAYVLTMTARAGRWEVTALQADAAAPLPPASTPTASRTAGGVSK